MPDHTPTQPAGRLSSRLLWLAAAVWLGFAGLAGPLAAHELTCTPATDEATPDEAPLDLPAYREQIEVYYYSGAYMDEIAEQVALARDYLEQRVKQGIKKPAIVLDIDETSLSNWAEMESIQFGYARSLWKEWVETASAYAIGPTLDLVRWAHDHDVAVFFVTGRDEDEREATERNLEAVGYAPWKTLYLEDESKCCTGLACKYAATCKSFYRKKIADEGYTIIVNIGDQRSDLIGGWAERTYKLPNPFYFIK